jgi:hypothetical protein
MLRYVQHLIDVVKNLQSLEAAKYGGFVGAFSYILRNEDIGSFYKKAVQILKDSTL